MLSISVCSKDHWLGLNIHIPFSLKVGVCVCVCLTCGSYTLQPSRVDSVLPTVLCKERGKWDFWKKMSVVPFLSGPTSWGPTSSWSSSSLQALGGGSPVPRTEQQPERSLAPPRHAPASPGQACPRQHFFHMRNKLLPLQTLLFCVFRHMELSLILTAIDSKFKSVWLSFWWN